MTQDEIRAPMAATVAQVCVAEGDTVHEGQLLFVLEAMKMEHEITAPQAGTVEALAAHVGEQVEEGDMLARVQAATGEAPASGSASAATAAPAKPASAPVTAKAVPSSAAPPLTEPAAAPSPAPAAGVGATRPPASAAPLRPAGPAPDTTGLRPDLREVVERHAFTLDAHRPDAVAKRHALGMRTARENIADLCDDDSFVEYGALTIAAQRRRRALDDLIRNTPADGMVAGIGSVNGMLFGEERSRCVVMSYDATVLAGTQGKHNHMKTDRMLGIAHEQRLPVVLYAEGGGGRPGDTDGAGVSGLTVPTFASFARLSGQVPIVGVVAGRCFAGNAALLGCCDVIIATKNSNIGMGGPAMVEGGGLGVFKPEEIGPSDVQQKNGVIDLLVDDEAQATAAARHYLSFFQGRTKDWLAPDPLALREALPANRVRSYDMRRVLALVADQGSLLELRAGFGVGIHTALARIEGRPVGLIANNPVHLGGAIDADAADKAARFMQLCNVHGLPLVALVDTPGFMVGPEIETQAQVRHVSRMFMVGSHLRVPFLAIVLRKGYGLGAMAMTGGGFHVPVATAAWPSGEFGPMGLEGAVRLGFRKELEAVPEGPERERLFDELVAKSYENGKAINVASVLEIDAVIDPAETRRWLAHGLASGKVGERVAPFVDSW